MRFIFLILFLTTFALPYGVGEALNKKAFAVGHCSQVVDKVYYKACYDYKLKSSRAISLMLNAKDLRKPPEKRPKEKRPSYYPEESIPKAYRGSKNDIHTPFDHGHMASDASFKYSPCSRHAVYSMINIVAQDPKLNRQLWSKIEQYSREKALKFGNLNVLNLIIYGENPKHIGKDAVAVPDAFYKILWNKKKNYEKCFYYKNDSSETAGFQKHSVKCQDIEINYDKTLISSF